MKSRTRLCTSLALAGLGLTAFGARAEAQTTPASGWALDRFEPTPAGDLFFAAERPWYTGTDPFALRFGIVADYARLPLVTRDGGVGSSTQTAIVENMLVGHAQIGIALFDRLGIHLSVPVSFWQSGTMSNGLGPADRVALGDPRLGLRFRVAGQADRDPISLHLGAELFLNATVFGARTSDNTTDNQYRGRFSLTLAGRASIVRWSFGAGFHLRPNTITVANTSIGNEIFANAGIGFVALDDRLTIGPEIYATTSLDNAFTWTQLNIEAILGIHYLIADTVLIGAGAGPGIDQGAGTPALRALFQLAYAPEHRPRPVAPRDSDEDGVLDVDDLCPNEPMGPHPDPERRGCPARDRDHDGVIDRDDVCVDVPAGDHPDPARRGCPLLDTDHDGVFDNTDQCPTTPAGDHPDPDRAGCPDGDDDADGVLNHADQCRTEPAGLIPDPARPGCPAPDRDHDTVPDATDHCPDQPGAPSPDPMRNGCPGLVRIENGMLRILQPVFFATNRDRILPRSFPVLIAVSEALRASPQIAHIVIEGHTDDVGDDARNLDLSQRRANSVMAWLVDHQIGAGRLEARGLGETHPEQPIDGLRGGALRAARAANRRVIFRIVDSNTETPAPAAGGGL